jgi:hypothetical protein
MANLSNLLTGQSNLVTDQDLAAVATTGSYTDLTNKPTIFSGSYTDLTNKPTGGGGIQYSRKTANYTAIDKDGIIADTSAGAFTVTLPASPTTGAQVVIVDGADWGTNPLIVARNGSTIENLSENLNLNIRGVSVQFIYDGITWELYAQAGTLGGTTVAASSVTGLATVATSGSYADLTNRPSLATVATSGSYVDLSNKPVVISLKITAIGYPGDDLAADPAGGQTLSITGTGFETTPTIYVGGTLVSSVSFISSGLLNFIAPAKTAGTYDVYVVNPGGATAIAVFGISYSGVPAWSTAAGSLGTPDMETSFSATVAATSNSAVTYSIISGALPSGISLNSSTGVISGTAPTVTSTTSYNFTIRATDAENQETERSFSMSVVFVQPFGTYTTADLFMHYDFSNTNCYSGSGTAITDLQGTRNGTVTGATFGGTGVAKYFDFEADSINYIAFGSNIPSGASTSAIAMEAWIYTESLAGTYMSEGIGAVWSSQQDSIQSGASLNTDTRSAHGGGPNGWHPQIGGTGVSFATSSVNTNTPSGTAAVSNRWDHVVMIWNTGYPIEVYKNGTNISSGGGSWTASINWSSTYWALGAQQSNTGSPSRRAYDGKIAIARIYNRRLSATEILANYNGQKSRFGL